VDGLTPFACVAGLRQRELRAHARAEERQRQLTRVHAAAAASLLDTVLTASIDATAAAAAAAAAQPEGGQPISAPTAAAGGADGLVGFLIPDVAREVAARLRAVEENKHATAARAVLAQVGDPL
jgi:acyl-coenzyme A thioesterase PaaI-like protein